MLFPAVERAPPPGATPADDSSKRCSEMDHRGLPRLVDAHDDARVLRRVVGHVDGRRRDVRMTEKVTIARIGRSRARCTAGTTGVTARTSTRRTPPSSRTSAWPRSSRSPARRATPSSTPRTSRTPPARPEADPRPPRQPQAVASRAKCPVWLEPSRHDGRRRGHRLHARKFALNGALRAAEPARRVPRAPSTPGGSRAEARAIVGDRLAEHRSARRSLGFRF